MPTLNAPALSDFVRDIFIAYGTEAANAKVVADSLVLSNLKGHDSHGVIRVGDYVAWVRAGWIEPNAHAKVIKSTDSLLVVDGCFGFGQIVGREATAMAIEKAKGSGVCVLSLKQSGHLGRVGEWSEMAADAGLVSFSFTNTHGGGLLVAPHGGRERKLSANPIGAGAPLPNGEQMILDFATSKVAEGKVKLALAQGKKAPPGSFVNARGNLAEDPREYYADPPGALLPFGEHKGFGLSLFAEILAGALSGAGCSKHGVDRIANAMTAIFLDPAAFAGTGFYGQEVAALAKHVKSSAPMRGFDEVILPGERGQREAVQRGKDGIPLDDTTWERLLKAAGEGKVAVPAVANEPQRKRGWFGR